MVNSDVDMQEVAITRRIYRTGESEFSSINGPAIQWIFRPVLADTGLGKIRLLSLDKSY